MPPLKLDADINLRGEVWTELVDPKTGLRVARRQLNAITTKFLEVITDYVVTGTATDPDYIGLGTGAEAKYADTNQDTDVPLKSTGNDQALAQSFQQTNAYQLDSVLLWMKRIGTSVGTLTVEIQGDAAGVPSGTIIGAASSSVAINGIATSYEWVRFEFPTRPSLDASTTYYAILRSNSYTYSAGVTEAILGVDESAPGYANGAVFQYDGTSWAARSPASDACFRCVIANDATFTDLVDQTTRKQMTSKGEQSTTSARLLANFTTAQANGRHGEVGMFDASVGGNLLAVANINVEKTNQQELNIYWVVTIS